MLEKKINIFYTELYFTKIAKTSEFNGIFYYEFISILKILLLLKENEMKVILFIQKFMKHQNSLDYFIINI